MLARARAVERGLSARVSPPESAINIICRDRARAVVETGLSARVQQPENAINIIWPSHAIAIEKELSARVPPP